MGFERQRRRKKRKKRLRSERIDRKDQRDPRDRKDQKEIVTEKVLLEREVEVEKMVVIQEKGTETVETVITNLGIETEIVKESVIGNVIEKGTGSERGKENVSEKWREGEEKGAKARVRVEVLSDLTECVEAETEILGVRKRSTRKERWRRRRKRGRGQRGKQERKKKVTRND